MCKTCDRIRGLLDAAEMADNIASALKNEPDEVAMNLLSATPIGRTIKTGRTVARASAPVVRAVKRTKAGRAASKRLSRALIATQKKARLKSGKLRKGWSQSRIMREAHKIAKRGGIR